MASINTAKLKSLRKYFLDGGSTDTEAVFDFLGTDDTEVMDAYIEALRKRYPDEFPSPEDDDGDDGEEEPQSRFFLQDGAFLKELELVKDKGEKVIFKILEPKDLVDILIGGTVRTVDLHQLRKMSMTEIVHGKSVTQLIALAEAAKA